MSEHNQLKPMSQMALHNPAHPFTEHELQSTGHDLAYSITHAPNPQLHLKTKYAATMIGIYVNNQNGRLTFTFAFRHKGKMLQVNVEHNCGPDLFNLIIYAIEEKGYYEYFRGDGLYTDMVLGSFNRALAM